MFRASWPALVRAFSLWFARYAALSAAVLLPSSTYSADTLITSNAGRYVVAVDRLVIDDMRLDDTLNVMLLSPDAQLGGFELKIAIPSGPVEIVDILRGEVCDSCHWELFQPRRLDKGGDFQIWQVVAMADMVPDAVKPGCFGLGRAASLARIIVSSGLNDVPDMILPIYFWWEDCSDNTIAGTSGTTLFMSDKIIDIPSDSLQSVPRNPATYGAPEGCIKTGAVNAPLRNIEFHHGGIEFRLVVEKDSQ